MKEYKPLSEEEERIGKLIVNAAFKVHKALGPGLIEMYCANNLAILCALET